MYAAQVKVRKLNVSFRQFTQPVPYKTLFVTTFARDDSGTCEVSKTYKSESPQRLGGNSQLSKF